LYNHQNKKEDQAVSGLPFLIIITE